MYICPVIKLKHMKQYKFEVRTYEDGVRFKAKLVRTLEFTAANFMEAYTKFFYSVTRFGEALPRTYIQKYSEGGFRSLLDYQYKVSVFILEDRLLLGGDKCPIWTNVDEILF